VYNNTLATVKSQTQSAENPTLAIVISVEVTRVDNAILLDYLTSKVALEEPEIGSTDPDIPIDTECTNDELHSGMPGGSGNFENAGDEIDAIHTTSQRRQAVTELEMFAL
jgi:hypothetical protein